MNANQNPHLIAAYREYMNAIDMCRRGMLGNASLQRESLRALYRIIAGKEPK